MTFLGGGDDDGPPERWERVASVTELAAQDIIYLPEHRMFLIDEPQGPIGLYAMSPHDPRGDERILFCPSSGWFEAPQHGERFDRRGVWAAGPASRGMDRFDVRVRGDDIEANVAVVYAGEPRERRPALPSSGDACTGPEGDPGFYGAAPGGRDFVA